ncbi:MAG TPA: phosphatidylserine decarboxylase [Gammaproteobacteria bacterium]|nr:phosphatidylserine decarboxylase [Gammaproteobacteria bacterium]
MDSSVILLIQIVVLLACAATVWLIVSRFPHPSPLIKPFLAPMLRWPENQIREGLAAGRLDRGFFAFFSRDPERRVPPGENPVAPADGVVNDIFEREGMTYIVIALSFWDVHVQRSPVAGVVTRVVRSGDRFMDFEWQDAAFLREKPCPVQAIVRIRGNRGEVEVRLITSYLARRINVWVDEAGRIEKGQRLGNITFGSTVTFTVPSDWPLLVGKGIRVVAGETEVALAPRADAADEPGVPPDTRRTAVQ